MRLGIGTVPFGLRLPCAEWLRLFTIAAAADATIFERFAATDKGMLLPER